MIPAPAPAGTFHDATAPAGPRRTMQLLLRGEHDIATAADLRRRLLSAAETTVVIDLSECSFLDGSIIGVLVGVQSRLSRRGGELLAVRASGQPRRTLDLLQPSLNFRVCDRSLLSA